MKRNTKNPPPSEGMRCAIYARKSDLKTESRGRSVKQQIESCLLAARSLGLQVDERLVFTDEDGSKGYWHFQDAEGRNPPPYRDALTRLVREVEAGNVDIVMCWRAERIARDEIVAALLLRTLVAHGVRLFSLSQDLYIHTTTGYTNAIAEANNSRAYSDKLSEDIKRHHVTNVRNGLLAGNPSMFGFRSAGPKTGRAIPVVEELEIVDKIFTWYVYGPSGERPLSCREIGRRLERDGVRVAVGARGHKAKFPSRVHSGRVRDILRNPAYCGLIGYDGEYYETSIFNVPDGRGGSTSVVPSELWHAAQARLDGRLMKPRSGASWVLCGLTTCPDCGMKSYPQRRKSDANVYCAQRGGDGGCVGTSYRTIKCRVLEEWIRNHLATLVASEIVAMRSERAGAPLFRELASLELQLGKLQEIEATTLSQHVLSGLDPTQIASVASRLRSQRSSFEHRIAEIRLRLKGEESAVAENPLALLETDDIAFQNALTRTIRWIAPTTRGVVVYTREGSLIGARYTKGAGRPGSHVVGIEPPTVSACQECLDWIEDPMRFLLGLRRPTSWNRKQTPDHELLPPELLERAQREAISALGRQGAEVVAADGGVSCPN